MKQERRELTAEEKKTAQRITRLWEAKQTEYKDKFGRKLPQSEAAHEMGITQGAFSQYINGTIPTNINIVVAFSNYLNADPIEIAPHLFTTIPSKTSKGGSPVELRGELVSEAVNFALLGVDEYTEKYPRGMERPEIRVKAFKTLYKAWFNEDMRKQGAIPILELLFAA
jgi:transcriptional regulator with XRE-family HTH domain